MKRLRKIVFVAMAKNTSRLVYINLNKKVVVVWIFSNVDEQETTEVMLIVLVKNCNCFKFQHGVPEYNHFA